MRSALAAALVIETTADVDDEWLDAVLSHLARALPAGFPGSVEWCSTPEPVTFRPNDDYDVRPVDSSEQEGRAM